MNTPSIDEMLRHVEGKYALTVAASKRARKITEVRGTQIGQTKAVSEALKEISQGKIKCISNYRDSN